jgi:hypothetical protein
VKRPTRLLNALPALLLLILPSCRGVQAADNTPVQRAAVNSDLRITQHSGCQLSDDQSQKLQQGLSQIQSVYSDTLAPAKAAGKQPFTVQLFCSEPDYRAYGSATGADASSDTGYYSLERREMVVFSKYGLDQSLQTIYHEASHALLRSQPGPYPKWLNEGLAEYFEGGEPVTGAMVVKPQPNKEGRIQRLTQSGRLPSLNGYLAQSNQEWQSANQPEPLSSTIGWSLVYFLMETPAGQEQVRQLVKLHRQDIDNREAINRVYPGGVAKLEQDWHSWIGKTRREHVW